MIGKKCGLQRILVTGATGVVGPVLVNLLVEKGYCVRIFSRHRVDAGVFPPEVEWFQGNLLDIQAVSLALKDIDGVFHLAAILHDIKGVRNYEEFNQINVKVTDILVNQARVAGVKRFVFFSTINVYGNSATNELLTERCSVWPMDMYARSKLEAEQIVLCAEHGGLNGFSVVILRVAAVYGKRMKGNYKTLVLYLKKGGFVLLGDGFNQRTLIFDRDLADAALLALEHPRAKGQIYNITDGAVHLFNDIVSSICFLLGKKTSFLRIPEKLVQSLLSLGNKVRCPRMFTRLFNMAEKQMESLAVSGEKAQRQLGFKPNYDLNKGWKEVIDEIVDE